MLARLANEPWWTSTRAKFYSRAGKAVCLPSNLGPGDDRDPFVSTDHSMTFRGLRASPG
ncbi:MAG: hypothetical protein M3Z46_09830 [Actinomycetota bacterium]|nr:hypothetical protein [Actinomycetota bacterium]